jgi:hypothetical protein
MTEERYMLLAYPHKRFCREFLKLAEDCEIPTAEAYKRYRKWSEKYELIKVDKNVFNADVIRNTRNKETGDHCKIVRHGRDQEKFFKGLAWREEPVEIFNRPLPIEDKPTDIPEEEVKAIKESTYEKTERLKRIITRNKKGNFPITWELLLTYFDVTFLNKMLEDGYLIKKPNDEYELKF